MSGSQAWHAFEATNIASPIPTRTGVPRNKKWLRKRQTGAHLIPNRDERLSECHDASGHQWRLVRSLMTSLGRAAQRNAPPAFPRAPRREPVCHGFVGVEPAVGWIERNFASGDLGRTRVG